MALLGVIPATAAAAAVAAAGYGSSSLQKTQLPVLWTRAVPWLHRLVTAFIRIWTVGVGRIGRSRPPGRAVFTTLACARRRRCRRSLVGFVAARDAVMPPSAG